MDQFKFSLCFPHGIIFSGYYNRPELDHSATTIASTLAHLEEAERRDETLASLAYLLDEFKDSPNPERTGSQIVLLSHYLLSTDLTPEQLAGVRFMIVRYDDEAMELEAFDQESEYTENLEQHTLEIMESLEDAPPPPLPAMSRPTLH